MLLTMTISFSLVALVIALFSEACKKDRPTWVIISLIPVFNVGMIIAFIFETNSVYHNLVLEKEFHSSEKIPVRLNINFNDGTETSITFNDELIEDCTNHYIQSAMGKATRKRNDILRNGYEHLGKLTLPNSIKSMEIV